MKQGDVASHSLRLNLSNEQHRRVEIVLKSLNPEIFKSMNQYIIDAIDFYTKYLDGESISITAASNIVKKEDWVTREDFKELKKELDTDIRNDVIRILGEALVGKILLQTESVVDEEKQETGEVGITDTEAIDLIATWG